MKRFTAILLTICLLLGLLPGVASAAKVEDKEVRLLSAEDYVTADLIWEQIYAVESDLYAKRAPSAERTETLIAVVEASPYYKDGTMSRNGDFFAWETTDGIVCGYSPEVRKQAREATPLEHYDASKTVEVLDFSKKGGSPGKENVYVIQPYYGLDSSFKEQYNNEAATIAADIGGIATTYRTTSATIDNIANAIEDGALVIFDSHGTTDYSNGEDNVSRANTSYLCLQVGTGFTSQDQTWVDGAFARYPHAFYGGGSGDMYYYCVDGTAIANHMEKNASNSFLWMAICLGMATDGMHAPLRKKGVEVAYGYSQSVTFDYDYKWEAAFWDEMLAGKTVAQAAATMKQKVGCWDWCHSSLYDTYEEAIATYSAFPIIVSSEDTYPGHGKVDNYQTVHSSWTLFAACTHENVSLIPATPPTCTAAGNTAYYRCLECNVCFSDASCTEQISQSITVIPATGHSYDEGVVTVAPTCEENGEILYTCVSCGATRVETMLALGHHYVLGYCETCGMEEPDALPFEIGHSGEYVIAVYLNGKYYAMLNAFPEANNKISGVEIEVIDGKVKASAAEPYKVTLNYNNGTYTIKNNRVYLKYASGTNLTSAEAAYEWKIAEGTKGSWRITSTLSTTRGVIFRAGTYMLFGGYSTANITTSGNYYDVEILPISSELDIVCEHQSTREEMTIQATCTTDGEISVYCADCGELLGTSPVLATGHNYEEIEAFDPTCEVAGSIVHKCLNCGDVRTEEIPAIGHNYQHAGTTEPTCEAEGVKMYICENCGDVKTEAISALGHTEVTDPAVAATCTSTGLTEGSHCSTCHAVIVEQTVIPAIGHKYEGIATTLPTCESAGVMTYTCSNCADSYTEEIPKNDHIVVTDAAVAATCTRSGLTEGSHCSVCGAVIVEQTIIPATGHRYKKMVLTEPTCENEGVILHMCENCKDSYKETIAALGHNVVTDRAVAATCTQTGLTEGSHCSNCGEVFVEQTVLSKTKHQGYCAPLTGTAAILKTTCIHCGLQMEYVHLDASATPDLELIHSFKYIPAGSTHMESCTVCGELGASGEHHYDDGKITTEATCVTQAIKTYTCSDCGGTKTEKLSYGDHAWELFEESENSKTYRCKHCETYEVYINVVMVNPIPSITILPGEHIPAIAPAVAATCTTTGLTEGCYCSVCNEVLIAQEVIPAIGHNYVDGICTNCGAAEVSEPIVNENLEIYHTLNLASDISMTFAVPMVSLAEYDSYYLECVLPEFVGNEQVGTKTVLIDPVVRGDYYYFTLTGITAVHMGDIVEAVLHMSKGGVEYISLTDRYSVATYAYTTLEKNSDPKMLTLCADLLRYGAEAQSFKGYRTDALVDAAMTDAQRAYLSSTESLTFTATERYLNDLETPVVTWAGKTLDLGSKVGLKFVFNAKNYSGEIADLSLKVTYQAGSGEVVTVILTGAEVYNVEKDLYSFTFYGLLASELRTVVEVAVYEGETQLGETLQYCAETYAANTYGSVLEPLTKALFAYSDSAKAFFAK